ncbi:MAG TPA: sialate O-acetylesterase [Chitinophagaceae bacterium]|nr:sialate O-acetylesterase [Chitinophagaceae bacterium]
MNMTLRYKVFFIFFLSCNILQAQVNLIHFPQDYEVVCRNLSNNKGYVQIEFELNSNNNPLDISLKKIKNQAKNSFIIIPYSMQANGNYLFKMTDSIDAGLIDYAYELSYQNELIKSANSICAGDYYIIYGQSNAVASSKGTSCASDLSPYIRTFGTISQTQIDNNWKIAVGDSINDNGFIGQLGVSFGNQIIKNEKIPVCIINGSIGGKSISYFLRNESLGQNNLNNAYGRLMNRIIQSNSQQMIRALLWYQGENDAVIPTEKEEYIKMNLKLFEQFHEDYPHLENIYMFQIKNACSQDRISNNIIQQAQLEVANQCPSVHLISTGDISLSKDNCHYNYENGYNVLGKRAYMLANHFQYNHPNTEYDFYPNPTKINSYQSEVLLFFNPASKINFDSKCALSDFYLNDNTNPISIKTKMNAIILTFNKKIEPNDLISYTNIYKSSPCFIFNNVNNQILAFHNLKIDTTFDTQLLPYFNSKNENSELESSDISPNTNFWKTDSKTKYKISVPIHSKELNIINNTNEDIKLEFNLYNTNGDEVLSKQLVARPGRLTYPLYEIASGLYLFNFKVKSKSIIDVTSFLANIP